MLAIACHKSCSNIDLFAERNLSAFEPFSEKIDSMQQNALWVCLYWPMQVERNSKCKMFFFFEKRF
jgi:hypothetical protein